MMNRMKKTMKRALATVLTLAMVLAMLPAGPVRVFAVSTQLTDPNLQYFTGDDFNDPKAFEANWNNVDGTVAQVTNTYQNASNATVAETDNSFLKITSASNATGKWVTPKNWAEGERPIKLSFKFRREYSNSGTAYLYFAYDPDHSYGAGLREWNDGGTNQPTIRAWTTTNSSYSPSDNSSKILSHQNAHNNYVITYDQWITIEAVYDWSTFDTDGKLKITYSIPEIGGEAVSLRKQTAIYTFPTYGADAPTLYPAFYTAGSAFDIDDVVIETNAQAARDFRDTYGDFLSQDPETMTSAELDTFLAMYDAWAALDTQSKAMLAGSGITQGLVDSFANVFASLCGNLATDDFESVFKTESWWNNVDGTNAYVQNGALVITPNTNTNTAYVTPKGWKAGERPTKLTFDYKDTDSSKVGAVFAFAYSPDGAGAASPYGGGLFAYEADDGKNHHNLGSWIPGKTGTANDGWDRFIAAKYCNTNTVAISDETWITIEGVYDWSQYDTNGKVKITYNITHVNGAPVVYNKKTFEYTFPNYANVKTLYPAFLSTSTTYCICNTHLNHTQIKRM